MLSKGAANLQSSVYIAIYREYPNIKWNTHRHAVLSFFEMSMLGRCPPQVHLLNSEHNADIMLLAARALTFLADVLPSSCAAIVRHGAVPAFCARLLTIEYIDLAEQSLQVGRTALPYALKSTT